MADNYLENKMADYRRGISGSPRSGTAHHYIRPASAGLRAFIIGCEYDAAVDAVKRLRDAGWQVAFTDSDLKRGRAVAQSTGAQHHPVDIADCSAVERSVQLLIRRWGSVDIAVNYSLNAAEILEKLMIRYKIPLISVV